MIKAGFIQFNPVLGDTDKNIEILGGLIPQAAGADIVVLPELSNSGYNFISREQAFDCAEETDKSDFIDFLYGQAKKHGLFIVAGINEKEGDKLFNSAVLVGPKGLAGKYRKIHLFMNEKNIFERGNLGLPVFDLGCCKTGMLICFDWLFPEVWRILALKGAELICHPSNLVLPYAQQAVPVHALINKTFVITANRYGTERGLTFSGNSIIAGTEGNTLAKADRKVDEVKIIELDLNKAKNKSITPENDVFGDRITHEYKELLKY